MDTFVLCSVVLQEPTVRAVIINTKMNLSFYELINNHRIEEVKRLISDDKNKVYSLLALAFEAGFSSKTSFNTIFKKSEGMTPSEYRSKVLTN